MGRFANSDTRDPAVNVTNWFLVVVAGLSVLIRLGTKFWIFHRLTSDDYLIIVSLAFCIAQSAAISTAVSHGYGYHFATISSQNFDNVMKSQYAAYILYIASLCLSKLSLSTFIRSLTPVHKDHFQAAVLQGLIAVLGVVGVLATIIEIVFSRDVRHSTDPTYDYCPTTIVSQVVQCASIVTACWGQLKPFLNQLKSNGLRIQGVEYQYSTGKGQSSRSYGRSGTNHSREEHHELVPVASGQNLTTVSASPAWDADSQSSQTGIIRETRTWVVTGDEGHPEHR
ncbi:uncharacterized protein NFIA_072300 [Aspergillus fischeri NRRL 181]|uniref:Rhodopsin domain-containing protein n=1 Tax=Neosartorya fischeri (strain ATCC 1020 / DSM 3700 / CBS 544.65 / FGSC A1164 / JCM 1740 / NRRL 181 / WB 181) TaxID=331117 RepID=A1DD59_NEOFI|nr:conserved hypothetical protein [Aspergillus fischeri NRRL 181]EAW17316.1 conserved hypothetical protein [Aspergillus fischeri NRRL 181]